MAFSLIVLKILCYKDMQIVIGLAILMTCRALKDIPLVLIKKLLLSQLQKLSMLQQL